MWLRRTRALWRLNGGKIAVWSVAETVRYSTAQDVGRGLWQESIVEDALRKLRVEFCSALRRRETEHTERREEFEFERVVSCGRSEQWGRA